MKEAHEYTEEERKIVKAAFRLLTTTYRRRRRIALYCFLSGFGTGAFALLVPRWAPAFASWAALPYFASIAAYLGALLSMPRLVCPGCTKDVQSSYGKYCPDCGSKTLEPKDTFLPYFRCIACRKSNLRGGREYFITRFCTHCGVMLDEKGICAMLGVIWEKGDSV